MTKDIEAVVDQLERAGDATEACGVADAWAEAGRAADLATLATVLASGRGGADRVVLLEQVAEHLAGAGETGVDALVRIAREHAEPARTRAFASRLGFATASAPEAFGVALARHAEHAARDGEAKELFACWLQELVLRDARVEDVAAARDFHAKLAASGHALGALPLRLLPSEREAPTYLPLFGAKGIDEAVTSLERGSVSMRTLPPPAEQPTPKVGAEIDGEVAARATTAVKAWKKVEAKVFPLAPALAKSDVGKWLLRALPVASVTESPHLSADRTGPDAAFGALFAAAANGGAHDPGLGGAYGRRAAWTSFAALVGAPEGTSPDDVDSHARGCGFVLFRGAGGWFFDVAWDVGVLALRADGASCAVVAATDSD